MAQDAPFDYGDRTIFQLRNQSFVADEFGTMVSLPSTTSAAAAMTSATEVTEDDPMKRLEQKLDTALRAIAALQQRIDSLDTTIARAINR